MTSSGVINIVMKNTYQINTGIDLDWSEFDNSIDLSNMANSYVTDNTAVPSIGTITITNGGTGSILNNHANNQNYGVFEDHYVSKKELDTVLDQRLSRIEQRLAILNQPSKPVLDRYESLRTAYEHYCTLEALMYDEIQHLKQQK